jgi:hypothetical protein
VTPEGGWLAGLQDQHWKRAVRLYLLDNVVSRGTGIVSDRASRWRDGRNAGTQGESGKRCRLEHSKPAWWDARERLGDGRVVKKHSQTHTRTCGFPRQNCSHISCDDQCSSKSNV